MTQDVVSFQAAASTEAPASGENPNSNPASSGVVVEIEGRKYTLSDLVTKVQHQDRHIVTLEDERKKDRKALDDAAEQLKKAVTAAELLNKAAGVTTTTTVVAPSEPAAAVSSVDDVAAHAVRLIDQRTEKQRQDSNWADVTAKLTKAYGAATDAQVDKVAQENGLTKKEAVDMARTKPQLFLRLFPELNKGPRGASTFNSDVNAQSFGGAPVKKPSGYTKARNTKQQIDVYSQRLDELLARPN